MSRFWKEVVGGQVQTGVYQAGPRHASKQYGSFKTGRPPRLPFQFLVYFEINPELKMFEKGSGAKYDYSALVRAIDMPSMSFTVEKKNQYNKLKPIITTKDFKPFNLTVYDDIESRWYALWQNYYNYHFMDGRFDQSAPKDAIPEVKDEKTGEVTTEGQEGAGNELTNRNRVANSGIDLIADKEITDKGPFKADLNGMDIHLMKHKHFFEAIHVFQIHSTVVTRTTAVNPVLTSCEVTQLDYASSGAPSELNFTIEYEKLAYGPVLNYEYDEDDILKELLEDVTKAKPFDPSQDKLKGIVKGLFGLEQQNISKQQVQLHDTFRDLDGTTVNAQIVRDSNGLTDGGFFSNLIGSAINKKLDEATSDLFKKNNKNINKLNFL